jgi:hypothetical protein
LHGVEKVIALCTISVGSSLRRHTTRVRARPSRPACSINAPELVEGPTMPWVRDTPMSFSAHSTTWARAWAVVCAGDVSPHCADWSPRLRSRHTSGPARRRPQWDTRRGGKGGGELGKTQVGRTARGGASWVGE